MTSYTGSFDKTLNETVNDSFNGGSTDEVEWSLINTPYRPLTKHPRHLKSRTTCNKSVVRVCLKGGPSEGPNLAGSIWAKSRTPDPQSQTLAQLARTLNLKV